MRSPVHCRRLTKDDAISETILRINVNELATVRVAKSDGTISEMPIKRLEDVAHEFADSSTPQFRGLRMLSQAIVELSRSDAVPVEFVIPSEAN